MKRKLKILAIISLLCICGTFLASCEYIDAMRNIHAVYIRDGDETKIQKNGKTYVELEGFKDRYTLYTPTYLKVTEKDVPVLLMNVYGKFGAYYAGCDMIDIDDKIYCPEDKYEQYSAYADGGPIDTVVTFIYDKDNYRSVAQKFTDSEEKLIFSLLYEGDPQSVTDSVDNWIQYQKRIDIKACDSAKSVYLKGDMYMTYNQEEDKYGLLLRYEEKGKNKTYEKYILHAVPDDNREVFEGMINKYYKMMSQSLIAP
ncbi:MAG: hypothetical protein E7593_06140 [Ruminococcaceae bacterium]|nr:hypothetical protein [Oscillospiraceae bacterium]